LNNTARKMNVLLLPLAFLFFIMFIIPFLYLCYTSFLTYSSGQVIPGLPFTLGAYLKFFQDSYFAKVIGRTFWLSFLSTAICVVMAYPLAFLMAKAKGYIKTTLLVLVTLPLISGVVVQTMGWYGLLTDYGTVNTILKTLHLVKEPVKFLGNSNAIVIGLVQSFLPYMVLPIMNILQVIPNNVLEAAENLGANRVQRFFRITFPLSLGGVGAGFILVFGACLSSYTTPSILGRGKVQVIGTVVYQQAMQLFNWPFAAAISMILLVLLVILVGLSSIRQKRNAVGGD